jgi:hypothetical protein
LHKKALNCLLFPNLFSGSKTEIIFKPKREVKLRAAGFFYWNENILVLPWRNNPWHRTKAWLMQLSFAGYFRNSRTA